jgi:hypothetical protein
MIFFGGVGSPVVVERQWVAAEETPKNRKKACKYAKYFWPDPGFSAFVRRLPPSLKLWRDKSAFVEASGVVKTKGDKMAGQDGATRLPKRANFGRRNLQAADLQMLPLIHRKSWLGL